MASGKAADSIVCVSCGAAFSMDGLAATVHCPFCGHQQQVARHSELAGYEQKVEGRVAAAGENQWIADSLKAWTASDVSNPARNLLVAYGFMIGIPCLLAGVLVLLYLAGALGKDQGPAIPFTIMGASYVGLCGWLGWRYFVRPRVQRRSVELGGSKVACPNCGAPGTLTHGAAVNACGFCGAALIATRTVIEVGVDAARAAQRRAGLDRRRAQRVAVARATNTGFLAYVMPVAMIGPVVAMLVITAIGFSAEMISGEEPFSPAIFILWGMAIGAVGGVGVFISRWRERRRKLRATLSDAAAQLNGSRLDSADDRIAWLNRYWVADYDSQSIIQSSLAGAATGAVGGYPALVEIELRSGKPPPRVEVLLPCWVPGLSDTESRKRKQVKDPRLQELGFVMRKTAAGLVAEGGKELVEACRQDPSTAHVVVPAAARLAERARELGFEAVGAVD